MVDSLPLSAFSATSYYEGPHCYPFYGQISSYYPFDQAWCSANVTDPNDHLQIDFLQPKQIEYVTIYGRLGIQQWVTSYQLNYSYDGVNFLTAHNQNNSTIFTGNIDNTSPSTTYLKEIITTKIIRIIPIEYEWWKSLRFEAYGYNHPCQYIYGGGWTLVRHSYNSWHEATDNLGGSDIYGTYDNNPQSMNSSWSIQYNNTLESDGSTLFMFSNGDCTEWLITRNDQFHDEISSPGANGHIYASHYDVDYDVFWYSNTNGSAPWISWKFATEWDSILYLEDSVTVYGTERFANDDKSVNVWIS